jgi:transcriptional regulator with XRE-family HTH domain
LYSFPGIYGGSFTLSTFTRIQNARYTRNACDIDIFRVRAYKHPVPPESIYRDIGALIKAKRKALGFKQEQLASELRISRGSLANIETGRQGILVHQLYKFAAALKLKPAELLPSPPDDHHEDERTKLPLPSDLKPKQRRDIARLFMQGDNRKQTERELPHAKTIKR